jgi:hypothetical protein
MPNVSKKSIGIAILVAALVAAAIFRIYAIGEGVGLLAIWNQNEAYIFSHVDRRGDSSSYLLFPWIVFKEYVMGGFAAAVIPADTRAFLVVLHVTPAGVERHVLKLADPNGGAGTDPLNYTPIEGGVYAMCPGVVLCRWTGDRFENVTQEEQERLGGINRLTRGDFEDDGNGWSRRDSAASPANSTFAINVGNQFSLLVNNVGAGNAKDGAAVIDLQRPGRASERIAVFERREGSVSRAEYRHAFRDPE